MSILCLCRSPALDYAAKILSQWGLPVTDTPDGAVEHLLLPVPSADAQEEAAALLPLLSPRVTVSGGNLAHPALAGYRTVDFLQDPWYLADNAAITADCAVEILENHLGQNLANRPVLILGWGRIGKCLGKKLQLQGADVSVAARKSADLAMLHALGCRSVPISQVSDELFHYDAIFNTVPVMILPDMPLRPGCLAVELASKPGMSGPQILSARGLPGKMAPAASGKLIAETFVRLSLDRKEA